MTFLGQNGRAIGDVCDPDISPSSAATFWARKRTYALTILAQKR